MSKESFLAALYGGVYPYRYNEAESKANITRSYLLKCVKPQDKRYIIENYVDYCRTTRLYCPYPGNSSYLIKLFGVNLAGADLHNLDLGSIQFSGVGENAVAPQNIIIVVYLKLADLKGANLSFANLEKANMKLANLEGADLTGANLTGAKLKLANLKNANLSGADLTNANLDGANLEGANLTNARLDRAILSHVRWHQTDKKQHSKDHYIDEVMAHDTIMIFTKKSNKISKSSFNLNELRQQANLIIQDLSKISATNTSFRQAIERQYLPLFTKLTQSGIQSLNRSELKHLHDYAGEISKIKSFKKKFSGLIKYTNRKLLYQELVKRVLMQKMQPQIVQQYFMPELDRLPVASILPPKQKR